MELVINLIKSILKIGCFFIARNEVAMDSENRILKTIHPTSASAVVVNWCKEQNKRCYEDCTERNKTAH